MSTHPLGAYILGAYHVGTTLWEPIMSRAAELASRDPLTHWGLTMGAYNVSGYGSRGRVSLAREGYSVGAYYVGPTIWEHRISRATAFDHRGPNTRALQTYRGSLNVDVVWGILLPRRVRAMAYRPQELMHYGPWVSRKALALSLLACLQQPRLHHQPHLDQATVHATAHRQQHHQSTRQHSFWQASM